MSTLLDSTPSAVTDERQLKAARRDAFFSALRSSGKSMSDLARLLPTDQMNANQWRTFFTNLKGLT
jgi:hypothetical protein